MDLTEELEALADYLSEGEYEEEKDVGGDADIDTTRLVVIDCLPVAPAQMIPKLTAFMTKRLTPAGTIIENGIFIPQEAGKTLGFAFVEFADSTGAATCVSNFDNAPFDKKHTMKVFKYEDFKHCSVADELELPEAPEFVPRRDLTSWLQDKRMRDHFVLRYDTETEVQWMEANGRPVMVYGGEREKDLGLLWTEAYVLWSPQGTYLLTFSSGRGVVLWGGQTFDKIGRMAHEGCHEAVWSPCERYLCTWNGYECYHGSDVPLPDEALIVWDVRTCTALRKLPQVDRELGACDASWSFDGSYLARRAFDAVTNDVIIKVYSLPSCELLVEPRSGKKRSIRADGARDISWAPARANVLAWWAPTKAGDGSASLTVMALPSREILKQKNLFNVAEPQLVWHPDGDYVALQALHLTKAQMKRKRAREKAEAAGQESAPERTTIATSFDLIRIKGEVTAMVMEIDQKVAHFAWEPKGDRFGIVHGVGTAHRYQVSFYSVSGAKQELLYTLPDRPCNQLIWSPLGGTCVLAGLDALSGKLEFYDVDEQYSYTEREHVQANVIAFDPSGRFVATAKSQPMLDIRDVVARDAYDNGFMLWTFQGNRIHEEGKKRFFQFAWRPRPRSVLTDDQEAEVRANLGDYIKRYKAADALAARRRKLRSLVSKRRKRDEFRAILADLHQQHVKERPAREALGVFDDAGWEVSVTREDRVLSQKVTKEPK